MYKQPYLYRPFVDLLFICLPPFLCIAAVFTFQSQFENNSINQWWWLVLVLGVDVTHVYTTLYKTYANPTNFNQHKTAFILIPFLCFLLAFFLNAFGSTIFWTILAYVAVFHFVRQQYGFMRLYSRKDQLNWNKTIDTITIYAATLYPIVYWHCNGPFEFNWFVANDFKFIKSPLVNKLAVIAYYIIIATWLAKEIWIWVKYKIGNLPKILIITGTIASWYLGIVYFESDITFTFLNVICHGVPYMALVWFDQHKEVNKQSAVINFLQHKIFIKKNIWLFLCIPLVLGFIEEYLWNAVVWKENRIYFGAKDLLSFLHTKEWKQVLIPLLILPQLTHYVIDGFIWKVSKGHISESSAIN